ncbi:MAG: TonB-dependent receptor [Parasphingorhabdus sp.]
MYLKNETVLIFILANMMAVPATAQEIDELKDNGPSEAAESDSQTTNMIVVTAQRRSESIVDVPISISAYDENFLERSRVEKVDDLVQFTPGVNGANVSTTTPRLNIRGVSTEDFGIGSDPVLGVYVDEIYLGRGVSSINDLFDVERVEIVKGPQGSLFGRNTTAGAISVTTNKPDPFAFDAAASASYGNFDEVSTQAMINTPLGGDWAFRIAGSYRARDGFIDNMLGGDLADTETGAVRAAIAKDGSTFDITLSGEWRRTSDGGNGYLNRILVGGDPFGDISTDLGEGARDDIDSYRIALQLEKDFGEVTLTSITGFSGFFNQDYLEDTDASPLNLLHFGTNGDQDTFSQELRLSGTAGRLDWFVGASAAFDDVRSTQFANYDEDTICVALSEFTAAGCADIFGVAGSGIILEESIASGQYENYAIYGDATFALTDRLDVTVGLRYSYDRKDFRARIPVPDNVLGNVIINAPDLNAAAQFGEALLDGTVRQRQSWDSFQPRFVLSYAASDDVNFYASATKGFKSGGFNQLELGEAFDPETIWSFEIGSKGIILDGAVRYAIAGYYYTYDDLQVLVQVQGIPAPVTRNAGASEGYGVELELDAEPVDGLRILAGIALQNAEYTEFQAAPDADFSGNALVRSPDFTASMVADYRGDISESSGFFLRGEYSYRSSIFFRPTNQTDVRQQGYSLVNTSAGLSFGDGRFELSAYAENLFDEDYLIDISEVIPELLEYTQRGLPRTFGVRFKARW